MLNPARAGMLIFAACFVVAATASQAAKERSATSTAPLATSDKAAAPISAATQRTRRKPIRLAQDEGCTAQLPYACAGANMCCASAPEYYCQNYQGPWEAMRGRSGCVSYGTSDEAIRDYSTNCEVFIKC